MKSKKKIIWYTFQKVSPLAKCIKKPAGLAQVWQRTYPINFQKKYNYEKPTMITTIASLTLRFNILSYIPEKMIHLFWFKVCHFAREALC
jgi:hypothetical protein